jgi:1-acyl-sn-glycerol-3-phosphate acyltransferase
LTVYPSFFAYVLRFCLKVFLRFYLHIRHRMETELPRGPKVFAVNHPTVWDAFPILAFVTTDFVHTMVEEQIWSFAVPRMIFSLGNQIVLYRGARSERSVADALFLLSRGHSVLIAPQGQRTDPGLRVRARRGVARLALEARAPIIPVGAWIDPADIIMRRVHYRHGRRFYTVDSFFPRFRANYGVVFGEPMYLDSWFDRRLDVDQLQRIATEVLDRIYTLAGKARRLFRP